MQKRIPAAICSFLPSYGLEHQLRRAAVSIPANIAEGFGKRSRAEKARFLNIAEGSVEECRYYLILSQDFGYGQNDSLTSTYNCFSELSDAFNPDAQAGLCRR